MTWLARRTGDKMSEDYSPLKEKILLLFFGGLALGCTYSIRRQWKILRWVAREWKKIDEKTLIEEVRKLYRSKLVAKKENQDGTFSFVLTDKGKLKTLTYRFEEIKIKKKDWDGKWRLVVFDIPEKLRRGRDALRDKLKELGFYELQKSVFILPFDCQNELEFLIEFFNLRRYVRFALLETIDNEPHLKQIFELK